MRVTAPTYKLFTQLRPGRKWHVTLDVSGVNSVSTCSIWAPRGAQPWIGAWHAVSATAEREDVCGNCARMWELRPAE